MPLNVSHINTRYDEIDYSKINDKLFKPLNLYSFYISPEPIRLKEYYQQLLYSECLINILDENRISMVSRCATQAFKEVKSFDDTAPKECFKTLFAFFPRFIEFNSSSYKYTSSGKFNFINDSIEFCTCW